MSRKKDNIDYAELNSTGRKVIKIQTQSSTTASNIVTHSSALSHLQNDSPTASSSVISATVTEDTCNLSSLQHLSNLVENFSSITANLQPTRSTEMNRELLEKLIVEQETIADDITDFVDENNVLDVAYNVTESTILQKGSRTSISNIVTYTSK